MTPFRSTAKTRTFFALPIDIDNKLRDARGRRTLSEVVTLALCEHLGEDPRNYGIEPPKRRRKPSRVA